MFEKRAEHFRRVEQQTQEPQAQPMKQVSDFELFQTMPGAGYNVVYLPKAN